MTNKIINTFCLLIILSLSNAINAAQFGTAEFLAQSCKIASHTTVTYKQAVNEPGYCYGMLDGVFSASGELFTLKSQIKLQLKSDAEKRRLNIISQISTYLSSLLQSTSEQTCGKYNCSYAQLAGMFYAWYRDQLKKFKSNVSKQRFKNRRASEVFGDFLYSMSKKPYRKKASFAQDMEDKIKLSVMTDKAYSIHMYARFGFVPIQNKKKKS